MELQLGQSAFSSALISSLTLIRLTAETVMPLGSILLKPVQGKSVPPRLLSDIGLIAIAGLLKIIG